MERGLRRVGLAGLGELARHLVLVSCAASQPCRGVPRTPSVAVLSELVEGGVFSLTLARVGAWTHLGAEPTHRS